MKLGTIPASSAGTIDLTYVPEFIYFVAATVPTSFEFNALGDGVVKKLDGTGLDIEKNLFQIGVQSNAYFLRLANGLILNKNATLTITNAVAAGLDVYGFSFNKQGSVYFQSVQSKVFANSGRTLSDFSFLGLPSFVGADDLSITFQDDKGTELTQKFDPPELEAWTGMSQVGSRLGIMNFDQAIKRVNFTPNADQQVYMMKLALAKGALNPEG